MEMAKKTYSQPPSYLEGIEIRPIAGSLLGYERSIKTAMPIGKATASYDL